MVEVFETIGPVYAHSIEKAKSHGGKLLNKSIEHLENPLANDLWDYEAASSGRRAAGLSAAW